MTYVLDTSALVGAWVRTYPPDVFPAFWERMDELAHSRRIIIPEEVVYELKAQEDDLHAWVKAREDLAVMGTTRAVMLEAKAVLADHAELTKTGTGRNHADPFVIATAQLRSCPVVTQEQGGSERKPRIPYVCGVRGVDCMQMLDLVRSEGWRF